MSKTVNPVRNREGSQRPSISNGVKIVILAAGKGKRMENDLPKVLVPLAGKPMIRHLLEEVEKVFPEKPVVVVGYEAELVKKELGDSATYALQEQQLGTGHAVLAAEENLRGALHVVVLQGDQPFTTAQSIKNMIAKHMENKATITFATTEVENFSDWLEAFKHFGRVLRVDTGVAGIREYKDASDTEKEIKEVNAGCYVFDAKWLWENLSKVKNENTQKEYYLVDLLALAYQQGRKIETMKISNQEALAANTKEELEILEKLTERL